MKYAIYDKAADGYLTKMEFDTATTDNQMLTSTGYTEYIIEARLLDTKEEADDIVARIECCKFMDKGRFVIHSFGDTLKDQYIISEAGEPTKVVDNITVDLDGNINVKYGTMTFHWSASSLEYAINRLNRLQEAINPTKYTAWCNTFDIYKVIPVIDERSCGHYQFIKVTDKGLEKYVNDEEKHLIVGKELTDVTDPLNKRIEELEKANAMLTDSVNYHNECRVVLSEMIRAIKLAVCSKDNDKRDNYISYMTDKINNNEIFNRPDLKTAKNDIPKLCKHLTALAKNPLYKRIEELEKANYELGETSAARGITANRLQEENDSLKNKVESIKNEARGWKELYITADEDRDELINAIDVIYNDLRSATACNDLKDSLKALDKNSGLDRISMPTNVGCILDKGEPLTAKDEIYCIIDLMIKTIVSLECNKNTVYAAEEIPKAIANDIIAICEANDEFDITLKNFSQLYEAIWIPGTSDNTIIHAFKSVLKIFSTIESNFTNVVDENVVWKNKATKAAKDLNDQKKLNKINSDTIARMCVEKRAMNKELSDAADALKEVNDKNEGLSDMLREITDCIADIMAATRIMDDDAMISNLRDISCTIGVKTIDDGPIYGISVILSTLINNAKTKTDWKQRAEKAICDYTKCNEALGEWKRKCKAKDEDYEMLKNKLEACEIILESTQDSLAVMTKERDNLYKLKDLYKRTANSVYGMTIPGRCCGKQMTADVITGKKILIDKEKYDRLMECVNNISLTYEMMKLTPFSMDRPTWLSGIINRVNDLTK